MSTPELDAIDRLSVALADVIRTTVEQALADALRGVQATDRSAEFIGVEEAAKRLSLGTTTVKRLIAAGELESVLVGRRRLVSLAALTAYRTGLTGRAP